MAIATINPATGQLIRSFVPLATLEIESKLQLAWTAFPKFRKLSFADRGRMMRKAADILESEREELACLMTTEMGKTVRSAVDEATKCAVGLPLLR